MSSEKHQRRTAAGLVAALAVAGATLAPVATADDGGSTAYGYSGPGGSVQQSVGPQPTQAATVPTPATPPPATTTSPTTTPTETSPMPAQPTPPPGRTPPTTTTTTTQQPPATPAQGEAPVAAKPPVHQPVPTSGSTLPFTGLDLALLVVGGLGLTLVGAGVRRVSRPRS